MRTSKSSLLRRSFVSNLDVCLGHNRGLILDIEHSSLVRPLHYDQRQPELASATCRWHEVSLKARLALADNKGYVEYRIYIEEMESKEACR